MMCRDTAEQEIPQMTT